MQVAEVAVAAARQHGLLAKRAKVRNRGFAVLGEDLGADRDAQHDGRGVGAGPLPAHAVLAAGRLEMLLVAIVDERVEPLDRLDDHVAAAAAVAAVGRSEEHTSELQSLMRISYAVFCLKKK